MAYQIVRKTFGRRGVIRRVVRRDLTKGEADAFIMDWTVHGGRNDSRCRDYCYEVEKMPKGKEGL